MQLMACISGIKEDGIDLRVEGLADPLFFACTPYPEYRGQLSLADVRIVEGEWTVVDFEPIRSQTLRETACRTLAWQAFLNRQEHLEVRGLSIMGDPVYKPGKGILLCVTDTNCSWQLLVTPNGDFADYDILSTLNPGA